MRLASRHCMPGWRRVARGRSVPLALALLAGSPPGSARGEPIEFIKLVFPPTAYVQGTAHFSAAPSHSHSPMAPAPPGEIPGCPPPDPPPPPNCPIFPAPYIPLSPFGPGGAPCAVWQTPFEIGEHERRIVQLIGDSEHFVAPHPGEPVCAPILHYATAVAVPEGGGIRDVRYSLAELHGATDVDILVVALAAFSFVRPFVPEVRGHVHGTLGMHVGNGKPRAGILQAGAAVPSNLSTSVGCVLVVADSTASRMTLFALVNDIPPGDILLADIHEGLPGANGPPVFDLAAGGSWQPMGPGSSIVLHETPFPPGFMHALLTEQCYLDIHTTHDPDGAVRAQIDDVSPSATGGLVPDGLEGRRSFSHPNPFVERTTVRFALAEPARVTLRIYDASGRLVRSLAEGVALGAGSRGFEWDGTGNDGRRVPHGVYVYRLQLGSQVESGRVLFLD